MKSARAPSLHAALPILIGLWLAAAPALAAEEKHMNLIPKGIRAEHEEIHSALVAATKEPGQVGAAARELADVLHPHFVREEEIALPPLGLLEPLAKGEPVSAETAKEVLAMTDALRAELPKMLEEHKRIREAVEKLAAVARQNKAANAERLADALAAHAGNEEEVLYPAAILVGDVLRTRQGAK